MIASRFATSWALRFFLLALLAAVLLPATLRADTVSYVLTSTDTLSTDLGSITGSFTVNTVTGLVNGTIVADGETFNCNNCSLISPGGNLSLEGFQALGSGGSYVLLGWSKTPTDANPITFVVPDSFCLGCIATVNYLSAGDTASLVPEPSTALLLMSGFAGLPFLLRRRAKT